MPYEKLAATLIAWAIIGCILLLTTGAIICFPGPSRYPPALRRSDVPGTPRS